MPRSRRRHHSRSRSRSNSHDRDREPKRRKVESFESPHTRRSVSSEPEANANVALNPIENIDAHATATQDIETETVASQAQEIQATTAENVAVEQVDTVEKDAVDLDNTQVSVSDLSSAEDEDSPCETNMDVSVTSTADPVEHVNSSTANVAQTLLNKPGAPGVTPQKSLTPKQMQKKLESEKKKAERQRERDERHRLKQQERDEKQRQRQQEKDAKDAKAKEERDAKQREKDLKDKEREAKRKEKEEKDEVKRKEREAKRKEKEEKQAEVEEKHREKLKLEEKLQKAAAAFTKFFVPKPAGSDVKKEVMLEEGVQNNNFMPFQLKSDMRLAPTTRITLSDEEKAFLVKHIDTQDETALPLCLKQLKTQGRKQSKTWPHEDPNEDVTIIESDTDLGEGINNPKKTISIMKAKYLKFHENQRPAYRGTWRKKSKTISGRTPFAHDSIFNYEVDSDDEWEEEGEGEDIAGSDDEKEPGGESENENDYEVDHEFFVPHGHLSDDEENDEEESITPEMRKAKEKLLKNQFDEERKMKTQKLKPRVIGCIWYNNNNNEDGAVDDAIHRFLKPFSIISNGVVNVKKRSEFEVKERHKWRLEKELVPDLLRLLHGNVNGKKRLVQEYFAYLAKNNIDVVNNKMGLGKLIKSVAKWTKCKAEGPMRNKLCWIVNEQTITEYNHVSLTLPNNWQYCTDFTATATAKETES